eukprot:m.58879 g.58879  ORF g.58879 m.58879 type:complete len:1458 (-) comp11205_c0_seq1:96-4469(-)
MGYVSWSALLLVSLMPFTIATTTSQTTQTTSTSTSFKGTTTATETRTVDALIENITICTPLGPLLANGTCTICGRVLESKNSTTKYKYIPCATGSACSVATKRGCVNMIVQPAYESTEKYIKSCPKNLSQPCQIQRCFNSTQYESFEGTNDFTECEPITISEMQDMNWPTKYNESIHNREYLILWLRALPYYSHFYDIIDNRDVYGFTVADLERQTQKSLEDCYAYQTCVDCSKRTIPSGSGPVTTHLSSIPCYPWRFAFADSDLSALSLIFDNHEGITDKSIKGMFGAVGYYSKLSTLSLSYTGIRNLYINESYKGLPVFESPGSWSLSGDLLLQGLHLEHGIVSTVESEFYGGGMITLYGDLDFSYCVIALSAVYTRALQGSHIWGNFILREVNYTGGQTYYFDGWGVIGEYGLFEVIIKGSFDASYSHFSLALLADYAMQGSSVLRGVYCVACVFAQTAFNQMSLQSATMGGFSVSESHFSQSSAFETQTFQYASLTGVFNCSHLNLTSRGLASTQAFRQMVVYGDMLFNDIHCNDEYTTVFSDGCFEYIELHGNFVLDNLYMPTWGTVFSDSSLTYGTFGDDSYTSNIDNSHKYKFSMDNVFLGNFSTLFEEHVMTDSYFRCNFTVRNSSFHGPMFSQAAGSNFYMYGDFDMTGVHLGPTAIGFGESSFVNVVMKNNFILTEATVDGILFAENALLGSSIGGSFIMDGIQLRGRVMPGGISGVISGNLTATNAFLNLSAKAFYFGQVYGTFDASFSRFSEDILPARLFDGFRAESINLSHCSLRHLGGATHDDCGDNYKFIDLVGRDTLVIQGPFEGFSFVSPFCANRTVLDLRHNNLTRIRRHSLLGADAYSIRVDYNNINVFEPYWSLSIAQTVSFVSDHNPSTCQFSSDLSLSYSWGDTVNVQCNCSDDTSGTGGFCDVDECSVSLQMINQRVSNGDYVPACSLCNHEDEWFSSMFGNNSAHVKSIACSYLTDNETHTNGRRVREANSTVSRTTTSTTETYTTNTRTTRTTTTRTRTTITQTETSSTTQTSSTTSTVPPPCRDMQVLNGNHAILVCEEGFKPSGEYLIKCFGGGFLLKKSGYCSPVRVEKQVIQQSSSTKIYWVAVVSIFGGVLLGFLLVYLVWKLVQRDYQLRRNLGRHELLLQEKNMELTELINAWEISPDDVMLIRRIDVESEGAFGEVWYAEWDGMGVAVKRLRSMMEPGEEPDTFAGREFEAEVDFLRKCRHRNIVRFFGAGNLDGRPFLVTEYLELGSLNTYIRKNMGDISESLKLSFSLDVQAGMQYLHDLGRLHRDLKSGNVLLSKKLRAKVGDFGSMRDILKSNSSPQHFVLDTPINHVATLTTGIGTPVYMAPEILRNQHYGPSADVWSFGILLWEIQTETVPDLSRFTEDFDWSGPFLVRMQQALSSGHRLPLDDVPKPYANLITSCTDMSPLARPTFVELGEALQELS